MKQLWYTIVLLWSDKSTSKQYHYGTYEGAYNEALDYLDTFDGERIQGDKVVSIKDVRLSTQTEALEAYHNDMDKVQGV